MDQAIDVSVALDRRGVNNTEDDTPYGLPAKRDPGHVPWRNAQPGWDRVGKRPRSVAGDINGDFCKGQGAGRQRLAGSRRPITRALP